MSITPDTKDWTWVLEAPCAECGLDTRELDPATDVPARILAATARFAELLGTEAAALRPGPGVWSPLEYACHVRDVCRVFDARLRLMLVLEEPKFENWDQDEAAVRDAYAEQEPARVARELDEAAARFVATVGAVPDGAWARTARRSDGAVFTVTTLCRYAAHELIHHAHDIAAG